MARPRTRHRSSTSSGWGGRRPGAGRKPGPNPGLPHTRREPFGKPVPAHVTLRLRPGLPSLRTPRIAHEIENAFAAGCVRRGFRLVHYSLQRGHAHLIVEARDQYALGRGMMAIGSRLAHAVNRVTGGSGRVIADRYHARRLTTSREVRNALRSAQKASTGLRPVASARTRLLSVEGRRHGLLEPA